VGDDDQDTGQVDRVDVGDVTLAVRSWGEPTSSAYLTGLAPVLTARGLRLVASDGPDFGESPATG
jgi:hypothetical protein